MSEEKKVSEKTVSIAQLENALATAKQELKDEADVVAHTADDDAQDLNAGCIVIQI